MKTIITRRETTRREYTSCPTRIISHKGQPDIVRHLENVTDRVFIWRIIEWQTLYCKLVSSEREKETDGIKEKYQQNKGFTKYYVIKISKNRN